MLHGLFDSHSRSYRLTTGRFRGGHDPPSLVISSLLCLPSLFSLSLKALIGLNDGVRSGLRLGFKGRTHTAFCSGVISAHCFETRVIISAGVLSGCCLRSSWRRSFWKKM